MSQLARKLRLALTRIASPVASHLPFVLYFVCTMGSLTLRHIHGRLLHENDASLHALAASVCIYFAMAYAFALLMKVARRRWVNLCVYGLVTFLFLVDQFLSALFGMRLSPQVLTLLAETTAEETSGFLRAFLFQPQALRVYATVLACVLAAWLFSLAYSRWGQSLYDKFTDTVRRRLKCLAGALVAAVLVGATVSARTYVTMWSYTSMGEFELWEDDAVCAPTDPFTEILYSVKGCLLSTEEMKKSVAATLRMRRDNHIVAADDSLVVILVLGESYIKSHAQIYGYPLPTAPFMESEARAGRLSVFRDAVTPYAHTTNVVRNLFCCSVLSEGERWNEKPLFPAVFKSAGYRVTLYDNQNNTLGGSVFDFALGSFLYNPDIKRVAYDRTNDHNYEYDGQLVDAYKRDETLSGAYNLVMFHLWGQHLSAADRFPSTLENNRFTPADVPNKAPWLNDRKRQEIADYDNATLYNDRQTERILSLFADKNAVAVILSDHGEEIYDYRDHKGRTNDPLTPQKLHALYDVPFMVWTSDRYRERHPDVMAALRRAVSLPLYTDDLCHLLFALAGIRTPYYNARHDCLSNSYAPPRRIVEGVENYDVLSRR